MDIIEQIKTQFTNHNYVLRDILKDASKAQIIDALSYCFVHAEKGIQTILVYSLDLIGNLEKKDWKQIVINTKAASDTEDTFFYHLEYFMSFLHIYCRIDEDFLRDICIPTELINNLKTSRTNPIFAYYHPSECVTLNPTQQRINKIKTDGLKAAGLSESDILKLFNMFTNDGANTEKP